MLTGLKDNITLGHFFDKKNTNKKSDTNKHNLKE